MARPKPPYARPTTLAERLKADAPEGDPFDGLRRKVAGVLPDDMSADAAASCAAEIVVAAAWASEALKQARPIAKGGRAVGKEAAVAELWDVVRKLKSARDALRSMTPDVVTRFDPAVDPLELADRIEDFMAFADDARDRTTAAPPERGILQLELHVALELAHRVAVAFRDVGGCVSAHASKEYGTASPAVRLVAAAGEAAGLFRDMSSWRRIVADVLSDVRN